MYIPVVLTLCLIISIVEAQLVCGRKRYTETSKYGIGPTYRYYYGTTRCEYKIEPARSNAYTVLKWSKFDIDDDMPDCYKNSVTVYIGCGRNEVKVGTFCSRNSGKPFPIISRDGCIRIVVKAEKYGSSSVIFEAEYTTYPMSSKFNYNNDCTIGRYSSSSLSESSGLITSPNWPVGYNSRKSTGKCEWKISPNPKRTHIMIYVFDASMNEIRSYGFSYCSSFSNDLIGIKYSSYYSSYDKTFCTQSKPQSRKYQKSNIHVTFQVKVTKQHHKGRGFVMGYTSYGSTEEERNSKTDDDDFDDTGPVLSTFTIIIIVVICVFCCCGCLGGCCKYLLKEEYGNAAAAENEIQNVQLTHLDDLPASNNFQEHTANSNHELSIPETLPMFNPEFSDAGPPTYANVSQPSPSNCTTPSAPLPPFQYQTTVSNDDAPPPSYEDVVRGGYGC